MMSVFVFVLSARTARLREIYPTVGYGRSMTKVFASVSTFVTGRGRQQSEKTYLSSVCRFPSDHKIKFVSWFAFFVFLSESIYRSCACSVPELI